MISLAATETCPGTIVAWETTYEVDTLGFNVYRDQAGQRVLLNPTFVPAGGPAGGGGHRYQMVDAASTDPSRTYWVEEVRFDLTSGWHGPVAATAGPTCGGQTVAGVTFGGAPGSPAPISVSPDPGPSAAESAGGCAVGGGSRPSAMAALAALLLVVGARRRARHGVRANSRKLSPRRRARLTCRW